MNDDIELILLSKLINKKSDYYEYSEMLSPGLFNTKVYRSIYEWLDEEYQAGRKFDLLKASSEIKGDAQIHFQLAQCLDSGISYMHNTLTCINFLRNSHKKTVLKSICQDVLVNIIDSDVNEEIDKIEKSLIDINKNEQGSIVDIKEHLKDTIKVIEKNSLSLGISGITSGF